MSARPKRHGRRSCRCGRDASRLADTHDLAFVGGGCTRTPPDTMRSFASANRGSIRSRPRCAETKSGVLIQQNHLQLNSIAAGASLATSYFSASTDRISRAAARSQNFPVDRRGAVLGRDPRADRVRADAAALRPSAGRTGLGSEQRLREEYGRIDAGAFHSVASLPGWTASFHKRVAFVGTSRCCHDSGSMPPA